MGGQKFNCLIIQGHRDFIRQQKGFEFYYYPKEWQFFEKGAEIIRTRADRAGLDYRLIHPPSALTFESSGDQFHKVNDHLEVFKNPCELGECPTLLRLILFKGLSHPPREVIFSLENIEEILVHSTELALSEILP